MPCSKVLLLFRCRSVRMLEFLEVGNPAGCPKHDDALLLGSCAAPTHTTCPKCCTCGTLPARILNKCLGPVQLLQFVDENELCCLHPLRRHDSIDVIQVSKCSTSFDSWCAVLI